MDIHAFLQLTLKTNIEKLSNVGLSIVVENSRYKYLKETELKSIKTFCKNLLLNQILKTGQVLQYENSKLAHAYGIVGIDILYCKTEKQEAIGIFSQESLVEVISIKSKDFYSLKKVLKCHQIALAGLSSEVDRMKCIFRLSQLHSNSLSKQIGVLLYGPSGCGKSSLVKCVAKECNAVILNVEKTDILQSEEGSGSAALKRIFQRAISLAEEGCVILFLDEVEILCPNSNVSSLGSRQIVSALVNEFDSLHHQQVPGLLVVGATNSLSSLDQSLRRPGRFDQEILLNIPSQQDRAAILSLLTSSVTLTPPDLVQEVSLKTPGYVGADLRALCEEADDLAWRRVLEDTSSYSVTQADFDQALHTVSPLMKRSSECVVEVTPVSWDDIGGLEEVKQEIRQAIEWPLQYPEVLQQMDLSPTKGVLLHGPPGCCKTTLVRAAASSCHVTFLSLSGAQVFSPYVGESEKIITEAFQKARALSPAILFFDEIETLVGKRSVEKHSRVQERILATLLNEMDGVGIRLDTKTNASASPSDSPENQKSQDGQHMKDSTENRNFETVNLEKVPSSVSRGPQVMVIGATNRPDMMDPAILRPGRLDKHIYVPPPDQEARRAILQVYTSKMATSNLDLEKMSSDTHNYTGADLKNLCKEAGLFALRELISKGNEISSMQIEDHHFRKAKDVVQPSLQQTTEIM